jgi:hypothetical protein
MNTKICVQCDQEMKMVPAGVSKKSGKAYPAFWSCDKRSGGCGATATSNEEWDGGGAGASSSHMSAGGPVAGGQLEARLASLEQKVEEILRLVRGS